MTVSYEPEDIVMYFLRSVVSEESWVGKSARQTNATETFDGDASTTEFTVSNTPLCCVNSVTISSVAQVEYVDYTVDIDNNKVIFTSAPASGTDNISIDYDHGSNWIFADDARKDLSKTSYPRIAVVSLDDGIIDFMGFGETESYDFVNLQIDVLVHQYDSATINGRQRAGPELARYLARQVVKNIKLYTDSRIGRQLFHPRVRSVRRIPFEEVYGRFRYVVDVSFETINAGESTP